LKRVSVLHKNSRQNDLRLPVLPHMIPDAACKPGNRSFINALKEASPTFAVREVGGR
jgi:hypothetical protein